MQRNSHANYGSFVTGLFGFSDEEIDLFDDAIELTDAGG